MRAKLSIAITGFVAGAPAVAADFDVSVEIPRLDVAEYHRPYVALWIERPDQSVAADLAVWYDTALKDDEGETWLKDLRQWWRRSGRTQELPVDGVSGATRPVGSHEIDFGANAKLAALPPGDYRLVVEAVREVGGRELQRIPFQWPPKQPQRLEAKGEHELGIVTVDLKP